MVQKKVSTKKKTDIPHDDSFDNLEDTTNYYSLSDLEQKIQNAQKLTSNIQSRISDLEMQSIFYQNQESTLENKKNELMEQITEINSQISSYKEKAHTIRKEIIDLQIKMQTAIKAIEVLQQKIQSDKEKEHRLIVSVFSKQDEMMANQSSGKLKSTQESSQIPEQDIFSEIIAEIDSFAQKRKSVEQEISTIDQPHVVREKISNPSFVVEKLSFQINSDQEANEKKLSNNEDVLSQSVDKIDNKKNSQIIEDHENDGHSNVEQEPIESSVITEQHESIKEETPPEELYNFQEKNEIEEIKVEETTISKQISEIPENENLDQQQMCIICHLNINYSSQMLEDPTSKNLVYCPNHHLAHRDCLKQWILYSTHCPLCHEEYSSAILDSFQDYITNVKKERSNQAALEKKIQEEQKRLTQQMSPDKPEYLELFTAAEQSLKSKQYDQAIERYWQILDQEFYPPKDPRTLQTMLHLSIAYLKLKRYPQAIRQLMNLVKIDYYYPMVFYFLGKAYNGIGLNEQSTWAYAQALENVKILVKSNKNYEKYLAEIEGKLK